MALSHPCVNRIILTTFHVFWVLNILSNLVRRGDNTDHAIKKIYISIPANTENCIEHIQLQKLVYLIK